MCNAFARALHYSFTHQIISAAEVDAILDSFTPDEFAAYADLVKEGLREKEVSLALGEFNLGIVFSRTKELSPVEQHYVDRFVRLLGEATQNLIEEALERVNDGMQSWKETDLDLSVSDEDVTASELELAVSSVAENRKNYNSSTVVQTECKSIRVAKEDFAYDYFTDEAIEQILPPESETFIALLELKTGDIAVLRRGEMKKLKYGSPVWLRSNSEDEVTKVRFYY